MSFSSRYEGEVDPIQLAVDERAVACRIDARDEAPKPVCAGLFEVGTLYELSYTYEGQGVSVNFPGRMLLWTILFRLGRSLAYVPTPLLPQREDMLEQAEKSPVNAVPFCSSSCRMHSGSTTSAQSP